MFLYDVYGDVQRELVNLSLVPDYLKRPLSPLRIKIFIPIRVLILPELAGQCLTLFFTASSRADQP